MKKEVVYLHFVYYSKMALKYDPSDSIINTRTVG